MRCGEPSDLSGADHLWRQFQNSENHLIWDYDNERWLPAPAALQFNPEMSSQWREHLQAHGLGANVILSIDRGYSLVGEWPVDAIERLKFPVQHTPVGSTPIECAHSSVYWPPETLPDGKIQPTKDIRNLLRGNLADLIKWVCGEITVPRPDRS